MRGACMHACMLGDEGSLVGERRWIHSRLRDTCHRGASLPAGSGTTAGAGSGAVVGTGLCTAVRAGNGTTAGAGNGTSVGAGSGTIGAGSGVLGPFATDPSRRQPPRRRKNGSPCSRPSKRSSCEPAHVFWLLHEAPHVTDSRATMTTTNSYCDDGPRARAASSI